MTRASLPLGASDDMVDQAIAIWVSLDACRALADAETAAIITKAMEALDDVARYASALPADDRLRRDPGLQDIDELVEGIRAHLIDSRVGEGGV